MKELRITAEDVATPEAGTRWIHSCLNQLGAKIDWTDPEAAIPVEWLVLIGDLAPQFPRLQNFLTVCPTGIGIISVAEDCVPMHVVGVVWTKGE